MKFHCLHVDNLIIGIDRTFNVGPYYLTAMSYKNARVISNSTKQKPICIGPIMLHRQSNFREYSILMSTFKSAISKDIPIDEMTKWEKNVIFGTDGEKALIKGIKSCFPTSKTRLCYLHLTKNVNLKLTVSFFFARFYQLWTGGG